MLWKRSIVCAVVSLWLISPCLCVAEQYPDRPLKLVVGYPAGGPADSVARQLAAIVAKAVGQPVIVENKGGAAGSIAAGTVARAAPDGYTIFYGTTDVVLYPALYKNAVYDPVRDFAPVTGIGKRPLVLVVQPSLGVKSVQELVALAKAKPGMLTYESSGVGSIEHLAAEIFQSVAGIQLVHVPYKGSAPAIVDLVAGRVQMGFESPVGIGGHIKTGKLVALVTAGSERLTSLPNVPTAYEVGMPGLDLRAPWTGIFVPAGTPRDRVMRLNPEFAKARNSKEAVDHPVFTDSRPITGTPEQFGAFAKSEYSRWVTLVKETHIAVE
jgi:tripartite-type tricarboxylate transporter receptor subunit TctC